MQMNHSLFMNMEEGKKELAVGKRAIGKEILHLPFTIDHSQFTITFVRHLRCLYFHPHHFLL